MTITVDADTASLLSAIESIIVVISVLLIVYQIRAATVLARARNWQSSFELSSPLNLELIKDPQVAALWVLGPEKVDQMGRVTRFRYTSLLTYWLILHENLYYQYRRGLLEASGYQAWLSDLESFVTEHDIGRHWDELRDHLTTEFVDHVLSIMYKT